MSKVLPISLGNTEHDLQVISSAAKVYIQRSPGFNPFKDQSTLIEFLRTLEEDQVNWYEHGIDPEQLQRAIRQLYANPELQRKLLGQPSGDGAVLISPPQFVPPAPQPKVPPVASTGGNGGLWVMLILLIIAGGFLLSGNKSKTKGLSGVEEGKAKPDPGTIPAILNGPGKSAKKGPYKTKIKI